MTFPKHTQNILIILCLTIALTGCGEASGGGTATASESGDDISAQTFSISGTVSGLADDETVIIALNETTELEISSLGEFSFFK
ncbi:MAG: hypothetical protein O3A01_01715 [bacterium]|nr:hypothetical protein [bacterium]